MATIIFFFILENWSIMTELKEALNDKENNIFIKSNYHQEIVDLRSKLFESNKFKDNVSAKNVKLTNLMKDNDKMSQYNNDLMINMGKQALDLIEINLNISQLSLFLLKTHYLKTVHEKTQMVNVKEKYQNKVLESLRKSSSLNDVLRDVYVSASFKDINCVNEL